MAHKWHNGWWMSREEVDEEEKQNFGAGCFGTIVGLAICGFLATLGPFGIIGAVIFFVLLACAFWKYMLAILVVVLLLVGVSFFAKDKNASNKFVPVEQTK